MNKNIIDENDNKKINIDNIYNSNSNIDNSNIVNKNFKTILKNLEKFQ